MAQDKLSNREVEERMLGGWNGPLTRRMVKMASTEALRERAVAAGLNGAEGMSRHELEMAFIGAATKAPEEPAPPPAYTPDRPVLPMSVLKDNLFTENQAVFELDEWRYAGTLILRYRGPLPDDQALAAVNAPGAGPGNKRKRKAAPDAAKAAP